MYVLRLYISNDVGNQKITISNTYQATNMHEIRHLPISVKNNVISVVIMV